MRSYVLTCMVLIGGALPAGCTLRTRSDRAVEHYYAGRLAMEREEYAAAVEELSRAVQMNPKMTLAHVSLGEVHRKQGRYDLAACSYEAACQTDPYAFEPHYGLGVTYQLLASATKAAKATAQYLRKAVRVYLRAITIKPNDFDAKLNLSACYFQQGKLALAEQYCRAALEINSKNPFGHSNLGVIQDAQGRHYDAIRSYKNSLELNTHQPKLLLNLGATYLRLGRVKDALNAFRLSSKQDPYSAAPWEQIGTCYYQQKKWDQAVEAYQKGIRLDPRSARAYRGLGVVYVTQFVLDRARTDLREKGLEAWQRSLELDSSQPDLRELVAKYTPAVAGPEL